MIRVSLTFGAALLAGAVLVVGCKEAQAPTVENNAPSAAQAEQPRREQALLDDLAVANRILTKELAILDIQAHVTARSLDNPNHYYIARFIAPGAVVTSDFIENDLDSRPVDGPRNDQAREVYLHGEIFKARPDVMAVVHAHTTEFVSYGLSSVPLWDGEEAMPVFDLRPFNGGRSGIISTPALGQAMAEKMGKAEGVLLWGHGISLGAKSIPAAITRVAELRDTARVQQATIAAGGTWKPQPRPVDDEAIERTWGIYKARMIKDMGGKVLVNARPPAEKPSDPVERAKRDLVLANRILASKDVGVLDEVGTISVRHPSHPNSYFIAPKVAAGAVTAADVVERDFTKADANSAALALHDEIYRARPEVKAVLFARPEEVVTFSGAIPLRATVNGANFIGDGLPVVKVDPGRTVPVTAEVGRAVAAALDRKNAVILSGEGIVMTGATIYNVADRAYQVKQNAKIQQQALALRGKVNWLVDLPSAGGESAAAGRGAGAGEGGGRGQGQGAAPAPGAQQLGPPEGRAWVYWAETVSLD
jgi:ribulose-5-phosphate 4-epimerase/fuculose-1-phosphate aldolase